MIFSHVTRTNDRLSSAGWSWCPHRGSTRGLLDVACKKLRNGGNLGSARVGRFCARASRASVGRIDGARPIRPRCRVRRHCALGVRGHPARTDGHHRPRASGTLSGASRTRHRRRLCGRRDAVPDRRRGDRRGGGNQRACRARRPLPDPERAGRSEAALHAAHRRVPVARAAHPVRHHAQRHPDPGLPRRARRHGTRQGDALRARGDAGAGDAQSARVLRAADGRDHLDNGGDADRWLLLARLVRADVGALLRAIGRRRRRPQAARRAV